MPEIKHDFTGGKMNKDFDERLVPNGEYRNAMNVQVRTTNAEDGSGDAGAVQNIQGNRIVSKVDDAYYESSYNSDGNESKIIASVANEKTNTAYFFLSSPNWDTMLSNISLITSKKKFIDTIIEVNTGDGTSNPTSLPVVVDVWGTIDTGDNVLTSNTPNSGVDFQSFEINSSNLSDYRIGMMVQAYDIDGEELFIPEDDTEPLEAEIQDIDTVNNKIILYTKQQGINFNDIAFFTFKHPSRVLNFRNDIKITGINIIDDLLFWTDAKVKDGKMIGSEPKRINIRKCKEGSMVGSVLAASDWTTHTQLKLQDPLDDTFLLDFTPDLENSLAPSINNDIKEEHVTVIRKAPLMAPTLVMKSTDRDGGVTYLDDFFFDFGLLNSGSGPQVGTEFTIGGPELGPSGAPVTINGATPFTTAGIDWREDDILKFRQEDGVWITAIVNEESIATTDTLSLTVLTISDNVLGIVTYDGDYPTGDVYGHWNISLQQRKPLFELKMGRFGLRYKYEDGEYSSFGPWSELAFLPGPFDYDHKKGYNLGMTNTIRELTIKDFIPHQRTKGNDIIAVDILYKTTDSPNIYVVKSIFRGRDNEWKKFTTSSPDYTGDDHVFGELLVTSEMIHKTLPGSQLLRSWDNVPKLALSQEIAANRLVYANYEQGYEVTNELEIHQSIKSDVTEMNPLPDPNNPKKSIKSIRDYKVGLVFGDKYGRETPVLAPGYLIDNNVGEEVYVDGSITVEKQLAKMSNRFQLRQDWPGSGGEPNGWIDYVKYYIKETTNEYYNLIMDRWYYAEDGNIWLSFISADRNKVDLETYLILKNEHGENKPVIEKARYKIIAIENEAPEFIKADPRPMGSVELTEYSYDWMFTNSYADIASEMEPDLLMTGKEIKIEGGVWNGFLDDYTDKQGDLQIRVVAEQGGERIESRDWQTVTYHVTDSDGNARIAWKKAFGENANMYARHVAASGTDVLQGMIYYFEFRELVFKNQPEFDGKFFAKIERDDVLEAKVLKFEEGTESWIDFESYSLAYVATQQYNPSVACEGCCTYCEDEPLLGQEETYMDRRNYRWFDDITVPETGTSGSNSGMNNVASLSHGTGVDVWQSPYHCGSSYGEGVHAWDRKSIYTYGNSVNSVTNRTHPKFVQGCADGDGVYGCWDGTFCSRLEADDQLYTGTMPTLGNEDTINDYGHTVTGGVGGGGQGAYLNPAADGDGDYCYDGGGAGGGWTYDTEENSSTSIYKNSGCFSYDSEYFALGCADRDTIENANNMHGKPSGDYGNGQGHINDFRVFYDGGFSSWDEEQEGGNGDGSGDKSMTRNGLARANETRDYWKWYKKVASKHHGANVFIDSARTVLTRMNGINSSPFAICDNGYDEDGNCQGTPDIGIFPWTQNGAPMDFIMNSWGTGKVSGWYYRPSGLDKGVMEHFVPTGETPEYLPTANDQLGRITLSVLEWRESVEENGGQYKYGWGEPGDVEWELRRRMTTKGNLFRFTNDPTGNLYKIISTNSEADSFDAWNYNEVKDSALGDWRDHSEFGTLDDGDQYTGDRFAMSHTEPGGMFDDDDGENPSEWFAQRLWWANKTPFHHNTAPENTLTWRYKGQPVKVMGLADTEWSDGSSTGCYNGSNGWPQCMQELSNCQRCGIIYGNDGGVGSNTSSSLTKSPLYCKRYGIRVEFRLWSEGIPPDENALGLVDGGERGIDTTVWDPRGSICHDGREALRIAFRKKDFGGGEMVIPVSDAAIWETEPKENVDLDIYYEASNAIPVRLNSENTSNFAPYGSRVTLKIWDTASEVYLNAPITSSASATALVGEDHFVHHIGYTQTHSIVGIKAKDTLLVTPPPDTVLQRTGINEGQVDVNGTTYDLTDQSYLVFHHPDGTQTMSKVVGFVKPMNNDGSDTYYQAPNPTTSGGYYTDNTQTTPAVASTKETLFIETDEPTGYYKLDSNVWKFPIELGWHNCWSFGNGVESDRIRDDYNAPQVDNGVKVSTTFLDYGKERRGSGMIYSGIYNSMSGVNDLNEFNMSEKITKDINPSYGSIQRLKTRDTDIVVLTEDKVLKVTTNKDALYNADGNPQLMASNKVLGTAVPFVGDYGISSNPESLAWDQYRLYFTDMQRGAALRLSRDGLTPISSVNMKTWFRDNLKKTDSLLGTYDVVNGEYNLTLDYSQDEIDDTTIAFNESSKGWVSFRSFVPQAGVSVGGKYLTGISENIGTTGNTSSERKGIFEHHVDIFKSDSTAVNFGDVINRNVFYATDVSIQCEDSDTGDCEEVPYVKNFFEESSFTVLFNDMPSSVKSFKTLNYEGSQAKVHKFTTTSTTQTDPSGALFTSIGDQGYYNLKEKDGWYVSNIKTDLSITGIVPEFIEKEGKWFNKIVGDRRGNINDQDRNYLNEFSVQGLGNILETETPVVSETININITSDMIDDTSNPYAPDSDDEDNP